MPYMKLSPADLTIFLMRPTVHDFRKRNAVADPISILTDG